MATPHTTRSALRPAAYPRPASIARRMKAISSRTASSDIVRLLGHVYFVLQSTLRCEEVKLRLATRAGARSECRDNTCRETKCHEDHCCWRNPSRAAGVERHGR